MPDGGIVIDFETGLPVVASACEHKSARWIAGKLASALGRSCGDSPTSRSVAVRLDELSGVHDETIGRLTALALNGTLTPATAARLALQHAREVGQRPIPKHLQISDPNGRCRRLELTLSGSPFDRFAFRLRNGEAWVGFAPATCLDRLLEVCPSHGRAVCLLVGCDAKRRTVVRILRLGDWRSGLERVSSAAGRQTAQQLLVLGGLPSRGPGRSSALAALATAVRNAGNTGLLEPMGRSRSAEAATPSRIVLDLLMLIELSLPGLVDFPPPAHEPVP
ncbi:hypothetical protein [Methylobacterium segetis]|uniref:hypothetical protein n=1 Tax=Methylobacterium segetis TaxID=2488750 RepID=UPI001050479D|nr:hypothetical protein [Methylobacterium segetis]